jgi:hypothetical protein
MDNDTRIEKCRRFEGIFVQKLGPDQQPLGSAEGSVSDEHIIHDAGTRFEACQKIAMTILEIIHHLSQLSPRSLRIQRQYPVNDVIRAPSVRAIEFPRLSRWLEGAQHHSCRVWTQGNCLTA